MFNKLIERAVVVLLVGGMLSMSSIMIPNHFFDVTPVQAEMISPIPPRITMREIRLKRPPGAVEYLSDRRRDGPPGQWSVVKFFRKHPHRAAYIGLAVVLSLSPHLSKDVYYTLGSWLYLILAYPD